METSGGSKDGLWCRWLDAEPRHAGGVGRAAARWRRWRPGCRCSAAVKPLLPIFNSMGLSSALTHPAVARLSDVAPQPPRSTPCRCQSRHNAAASRPPLGRYSPCAAINLYVSPTPLCSIAVVETCSRQCLRGAHGTSQLPYVKRSRSSSLGRGTMWFPRGSHDRP